MLRRIQQTEDLQDDDVARHHPSTSEPRQNGLHPGVEEKWYFGHKLPRRR